MASAISIAPSSFPSQASTHPIVGGVGEGNRTFNTVTASAMLFAPSVLQSPRTNSIGAGNSLCSVGRSKGKVSFATRGSVSPLARNAITAGWNWVGIKMSL